MNRLRSEERGASAVEYALLITGIAAVIVLAVFALGPVTNEMFTDTCGEFDSHAMTAAGC